MSRQIMSRPADHRVFISYARKDGAELAQRLRKDLEAKGFEAWLDTSRNSGGATWTVEIERAIDRSQVVLALLTRGAYVSDICRAEQLRSLRKGKSVIPIMAQTSADVPLHLETKNYRDFTDAKSYTAQFRLLINDIGTGKGGVPLPEKYRTTYVTAPPLPRNYVERTDAVSNLRNALITDDPGPSIALTALRGMAGIGKTILAQAISHDDVVQQAFPDGIIWSTAGKEPAYDLVTRMREVRRALGDEAADKESEVECMIRYRTVLREKAALVIVDDVGRAVDIEPFLAESPRSRLLLTTRDSSIAVGVGADEHVADLLTEEESRALLARWAGLKVKDLPAEAADVIRECGRLALALSMVGAMLRGKPFAMWAHVLDLLRRADLEKIKAQFPNYPHADLLRAIQVSVDALDEVPRQRYFALAVLLEDMAAAPAVQQTLWNAREEDALETGEQFIGLSLAQRDGTGIRLHDLQLDYVRAQYPDQAALGLIHGAVRLSINVIARDARQFGSQLTGRLLPHQDMSAIRRFAARVVEGAPTPWLRLLKPALHPPGTSLIRTLEGHSSSVHGVAVSADGRRAVSASVDKTLKVWDVETGGALRTLQGHSDLVNGVAVSADGRRALSGSDDNTLKVWDLTRGASLATFTCDGAAISCAFIDPHRLIAGDAGGRVYFLRLEEEKTQ